MTTEDGTTSQDYEDEMREYRAFYLRKMTTTLVRAIIAALFFLITFNDPNILFRVLSWASFAYVVYALVALTFGLLLPWALTHMGSPTERRVTNDSPATIPGETTTSLT